jgi:hypothetical protein
VTYERKQQLKDALASGKALPTELRKQARDLGKDLAFDEAQAGGVDANFIYARRTLTLQKCRTDDAHRQRIFESRDNRPEDHPDDVEGPELEVVAVRQGKEELPLPYPVCA